MAAEADTIIVHVYALLTWVILALACVKVWRISQVVVPVKGRITSCGPEFNRRAVAWGNLDSRDNYSGHQIYTAKEDPRTNEDVR